MAASTLVGTTPVRDLGTFQIGQWVFLVLRRPGLAVVWLRIREESSAEAYDFGTIGDLDSRSPRPRIDPRYTSVGWGRPDVLAVILREARDRFDADEEANGGH